MRHGEVPHVLALLLATVVASVQVPDPALSLANERSSIERTYELTKYLEHQLREIKDTYLSYLGPPFSDPDFSPPRPNTTALSLPSAATRLDLWRGLENRARLAQNHRAYSVLLGAVKELARATLCPYLQSSLLHFSVGLDGLLGSISGLMTTLGYTLPPHYYGQQTGDVTGHSQDQRNYNLQAGGTRAAKVLPRSYRYLPAESRIGGTERDAKEVREEWAGREAEREAERESDKEREEKGETEEKGQKEGTERWKGESEERVEEFMREGEIDGWGRRRRLLSLPEEGDLQVSYEESRTELRNKHLYRPLHLSDSSQRTRTRTRMVSLESDPNRTQAPGPRVERTTGGMGHSHRDEFPGGSLNSDSNSDSNSNRNNNSNSNSNSNSNNNNDRIGEVHLRYTGTAEESGSSAIPTHYHRRTRSLTSPLSASTLHPTLSPFSLFYQFGAGEGHTVLSGLAHGSVPPLLPSLTNGPPLASPSLNDFSRKVESFWVLRELQSWLWRSAKDFNRLKKRLRV